MPLTIMFPKQAFRRMFPSLTAPIILMVLCLLSPCSSIAARDLRRPVKPTAAGSLPALLFSDGVVCTVDEKWPSVCVDKLVRVDRRALKPGFFTFYGIFDIDNDGSPEVFLDYWPFSRKREVEYIVLLVYKKTHGRYRQYLRLKAESHGYAPGAWFLDEKPHPKAIFMTRYGGSSGFGLFYLSPGNKNLDEISDGVFLEDEPVFEDLDGDGTAEIFLPGRGRDRTSNPGNALLRWNGEGYDLWWPNWSGAPYVMYVRLIDLDRDGRKEIAAILDPDESSCVTRPDGIMAARELAVWKVVDGNPILCSKTEIPKSKYLSEPHFDLNYSPGAGRDINLSYTRTLGCDFRDGKLGCRDASELQLNPVENR